MTRRSGAVAVVTRAARMAVYQIGQRRRRPPRPVPGVRFERDVAVSMRDGVRLMANVFRPEEGGPCPVVMSVSPYGKDLLPEDYGLFRALGMEVGPVSTSDYCAFEAPDHRHLQKVRPGEVVQADVEILPSSTLFEAGSSLRVVIQGHELRDYPAFGHRDSVNRGRHRLFTGGRYDSFLAVPVVER